MTIFHVLLHLLSSDAFHSPTDFAKSFTMQIDHSVDLLTPTLVWQRKEKLLAFLFTVQCCKASVLVIFSFLVRLDVSVHFTRHSQALTRKSKCN